MRPDQRLDVVRLVEIGPVRAQDRKLLLLVFDRPLQAYDLFGRGLGDMLLRIDPDQRDHRDDGEANIDDADHAAPRLIDPGTPRPFALAGRAGAVVRTALRSVAARARGLRASSSSPAFTALRTGAQRDAS